MISLPTASRASALQVALVLALATFGIIFLTTGFAAAAPEKGQFLPPQLPSDVCGTFSNSATIIVPASGGSGIAAPYPSNIVVSGLGGAITKVTVALNGVILTREFDVDVLLVGPGGQNAIIMSDVGGFNTGFTGVNLVLDDTAANPLPAFHVRFASGTFRPTNIQDCDGPSAIDTFPAPALTPSGAVPLSVFNGTNPNGTWSLYVVNDLGPSTGNFAGGWAITILTDNCAGPTATPMPTPAVGAATHLAVSAPGSVAGQFNVTVTALDQFNNTATTYGGTVHFTTSDPFGSSLPGDSGLTNGSGTFTASLGGIFTEQSITVTDISNPSITGTSNCIFIGKQVPPTPTPTPAPTPISVISISGTVRYCSDPNQSGASGVTMTLAGSSSGSASSNGSGNYIFNGLTVGGSYTVTASKPALAPGSAGITTVDVLAVQRHYLNIGPIPAGCRLTAANVNGDTSINTVDVVAIQRFFLGLSAGVANVGKYQFNPASRSYSGVMINQLGQNYDALIFGDVAAPFAE